MQAKHWENNLNVLKNTNPVLYRAVINHEYHPVGEVLTTPSGLATLRYYMPDGSELLAYGSDPWQDAAVHLRTISEDSTGVVVFVGMGLGYGPLRVLKERHDICKMVILEPSLDVLCAALKNADLTQLLENPKVFVYSGEFDQKILEQLISREVSLFDTHILRHVPSFSWNKALYEAFNDQTFQLLNKINAMGATTNFCGEAFVSNRHQNLSLIRHCCNSDTLKDIFKGKPALLVAAGPSLDQSLDEIRKAKGRCLIVAVDSALITLLKAGIEPDIVTSLDLEDVNFEKVAPFLKTDWRFSLATTLKCSPLILKRLSARHTFLCFNEDIPQMWMIRELGVKHLLPPLLSVAHLSAGIAHLTGANPLILVGQDLSYTKQAGSDHASGVIFHEKGLPKDKEIFYVKAKDGTMLPTDRGLMSLQRQFEEIIARSSVRFINATAKGAHIEGAEDMSLADAIQTFMADDMDAVSMIDDAVRKTPRWRHTAITGYAGASIAHAKKVLEQLKKAEKLIKSGLNALAQLKLKGYNVNSLDELPAKIREEMLKIDAINNKSDSYQELWNQMLEMTYSKLKANDEKRYKNNQIREKEGYLSWLDAELNRLKEVQGIRIEVIEQYCNSLGVLCEHLKKEDVLLKKFDNKQDVSVSLELARLYEEAGDALLAYRAMKKAFSGDIDNPDVLLMMGLIEAELLDFEAANKWFQKVFHKASPEPVSKARKRAAEPWLEAIKKQEYIPQQDGHYLRWGEKYPHLLAKWLERVKSCAYEQTLAEISKELWPVYAERIEKYLTSKDMEKAQAILDAWALYEGELDGYAFLNAGCQYQKDDIAGAYEALKSGLAYCHGNADRLAFAARVCMEAGDMAQGLECLRQAVELKPAHATIYEELGDALFEADDFEGSIAAYEQCLMTLPDRIELLKKIGDCYLKQDKPEAAKAAYEAVAQRIKGVESGATPQKSEELFKQGFDMHKQGRLEEAISLYRQSIEAHPANHSAWSNLGVALHGLKRFEEALEAFNHAVSINNGDVDTQYNLGVLYLDMQRVDQAKSQFLTVISKNPNHGYAYNNLGHIFLEQEGKAQEALECFRNALLIEPDVARTHYNIAHCLEKLLKIPESIEFYRKAIDLDPNLVEAHWNLSHVLMLNNEVRDGFKEYLWRWKRKQAVSLDDIQLPMWAGEQGAGVVLVHTEQGAGDNIQFIRYLKLLKETGKKVILACNQDVARLFECLEWVDEIVMKSKMGLVYDRCRWHVPLLNLPTIFQTDLATIPDDVPYLRADKALSAKYEAIFANHQDKLKIGFVWKGNPQHNRDVERSCALEAFNPLFELDGTSWFSLQYQHENQLNIMPNVIDLSPYLFDFAHTAALVEHLDLVITVDTSVAHLAGALGKRVWTLVTWLPDWRWGLGSEKTPWYPSMRLFRQSFAGDWQGVFERIKGEVRGLILG